MKYVPENEYDALRLKPYESIKSELKYPDRLRLPTTLKEVTAGFENNDVRAWKARIEGCISSLDILISIEKEKPQLIKYGYKIGTPFFRELQTIQFFIMDAHFQLLQLTTSSTIEPEAKPEAKPDKTKPVVNFEDIFNDDYKDIEPKIYEHYKNAKAIHLAYMLFAISDFGIIDKSVLNGNMTHLHQALIGRGFFKIGTRQNLSYNIQNLHGASKKQEGKLKSHKENIKTLLKENLQNLQI